MVSVCQCQSTSHNYYAFDGSAWNKTRWTETERIIKYQLPLTFTRINQTEAVYSPFEKKFEKEQKKKKSEGIKWKMKRWLNLQPTPTNFPSRSKLAYLATKNCCDFHLSSSKKNELEVQGDCKVIPKINFNVICAPRTSNSPLGLPVTIIHSIKPSADFWTVVWFCARTIPSPCEVTWAISTTPDYEVEIAYLLTVWGWAPILIF